MIDDIIDFIEDFWFIPVIIAIVAGAGCAVHFGWIDIDHDHDSSTNTNLCEVEIVCDEGIFSSYGEGTYYVNSTVELDNYVNVGWFFDGWYDSKGNLLSEEQEYKFNVTKSCTVYAKTTRGYGVNLYKMPGINYMTGRGTYDYDENATITAVTYPGYTFTGWYDLDKNLVSTEPTLLLSNHEDVVLFAGSSSSNPYIGENARTIGCRDKFSENESFMILMNDRTSEVVDYSKGNHEWGVNVAPGQYYLLIKGMKNDGQYGVEEKTIIVDGISTNVYHWDFNHEHYTLTWDLDMATYRNYIDFEIDRSPQKTANRTDFVYYTSNSVQTIAGKLTELSAGMTDVERTNFVLKFVQLCTDYERDREYVYSNRASDYWKYPLETLFEGRGDCEDTSILYSALVKAMGYDTAILLYLGEQYKDNGHAATSVALDSVPGGTYYEKNGKHFYYCESTSDTMIVGEIWTDYDRGQVLVIP